MTCVCYPRAHPANEALLGTLFGGAQAAFARAEREEAEAVYYGTAQLAYPLAPLTEELPGTDVTLPLFKHLAAVIGAALCLACVTMLLWRLGGRQRAVQAQAFLSSTAAVACAAAPLDGSLTDICAAHKLLRLPKSLQ